MHQGLAEGRAEEPEGGSRNEEHAASQQHDGLDREVREGRDNQKTTSDDPSHGRMSGGAGLRLTRGAAMTSSESPPPLPGSRPVSSFMLDEMEEADAKAEERRRQALPEALTVVTWNVEWAPPRKREAIRQRLLALDADVIVLTEGDRGVLPDGGHWIDGGSDWGYTTPDAARRKVILWSRHPLRNPNFGVNTDVWAGQGRFTSAGIETTRGEIRIFGVCIPWRDAHVRSGRRGADPWSEHRAYLDGLTARLNIARRAGSTCILGDFNQRIPRRRTPGPVYDALMEWLTGFTVLTSGEISGLDEQPVDHIATTGDLTATDVRGIDRHEDGVGVGRELSDHHLVMCRIARAR